MPYWERQVGGNCRIHALNAFYCRQEITPEIFANYCREYNAYMLRKFGTKVSAMEFDSINNDQQNIVAYILGHHYVAPGQAPFGQPLKRWRPVVCKYRAVGQVDPLGRVDRFGQPVQPLVMGRPPASKFVFIFNAGHIWGAKWVGNAEAAADPHSGQWYILDSLSGEKPIRLEELVAICAGVAPGSPGTMITLEDAASIEKEWREQVEIIRKIVGVGDVKAHAIALLTKLNEEKKVLGDLEIPLGVAMNIIELYMIGNVKEFVRVVAVHKKYAAFVRDAYRWNDLQFVLSTLPDVIAGLLSL